jgi:Saxitoxin biosynthesis operon protein SxtJ
MSANFHENLARKHEVKSGSDRAFGLVMAAACCCVAGYGVWVGSSNWPYWLAAAIAFATAALLWPALLAPLNRLWFQLGRILHRVVNPLVMGVLFFLVITPIGLLMRVFGKRPLALDFAPEATSYWLPRGAQPGPMTKQG